MKKSSAFLVLILSIIIFCLPSSASDSSSRNKAVARRVFDEIYNQGKFEAASELYAKDFVNHGLTRDIGLKEDQDAARGWKLAFPDLKITVLEEIAEGNLVTVLWAGTGTNTGAGNGLPATGKSGRIRGITIWRIVNGKITEEWSAFDQLSIMRQLGLVPEPGK